MMSLEPNVFPRCRQSIKPPHIGKRMKCFASLLGEDARYTLMSGQGGLLRWFAFRGSSGAGDEVPHAFLSLRIVEGIVQVLWSASGGVMEKHALNAGGSLENRADESSPHPQGRVERRPNWLTHYERLSPCSEIGWSKLEWLRGIVGELSRSSACVPLSFQATDSSQKVEAGGEDRCDGPLYQGRSSGNMSATARKPPTSAMATTKILW